MIENLSIGLDIATALSVIAAATAFIWNSVLARKKDRNDRRKEIIKASVIKVSDDILRDSNNLFKEIKQIESNLIDNGLTVQNLNPWRDSIQMMPLSFNRLTLIDTVYGDGRFKRLAQDYEKELNDFILYFARLVSPESEEKWDFEEVMNKPIVITQKYLTRLHRDAEDYFTNL